MLNDPTPTHVTYTDVAHLIERVENLETRVAKLTKLILQSLPQFAAEVDAMQSKTLG